MKYQEEFFHNQIESIHKITEAKEKEFEKLLQEERAKARHFDVESGTTEDRRLRWVTNSQLDGNWSNEYSEAFLSGIEKLCLNASLVRIASVFSFDHLT